MEPVGSVGASSSASMNHTSPEAVGRVAASRNCDTAALRLPGTAGYSPASTCAETVDFLTPACNRSAAMLLHCE